MNTRTNPATLTLLMGLILAGTSARSQELAPIKTTAEEVILDLVVRDKKGRPIKDLRAEELAVFDNGQKQTIRSFRLVEGAEAIAKGEVTPLDPLRALRLVTLVFEPLSPDGRRIARQAATDLIKGQVGTNVFFAVVTINNGLFALQEFTRDKERLKAAIERATNGQYAGYAAESERIRNTLRASLQSTLTPQGDAASSGVAAQRLEARNQAPGAGNPTDRVLGQILLDMIRFDTGVSTAETTRTSIFALLTLVRGQKSLPGRKTILYFSEGMWIPTHLDEPFRAVMSTANRENVTFYAVDTRGVLTGGQNQWAADALRHAARAAAEDAFRDPTAGDQRVSKEQILAGDSVQDAMRNNVQMPLRDLAESTGGFLIADANDLRVPLRQINEEVNSYYEIAYAPGITTYDGSFRKTVVEAARKDLVLHSRKGYFALPPEIRGTSVLPYELPLLQALDSRPLPRDLEFRSAILRFQPRADGIQAQLMIEVPLSQMTFVDHPGAEAASATAKNAPPPAPRLKGRLSVLALIKTSDGEVIQKFSRDLPLAPTKEQAPQVQAGNFVYKENLELPPGRFTLEAAVIDHVAGKRAARKTAVVVTPKTQGVSLSSMMVVRSYQPNAAGLTPEEPFQFQGGRITPTLSSTIYAVPGAQLSTFFIVYPDPRIPEKPQVILEYIKDGESLGKGEVPLPDPNPAGKIPYVMSSPAENMPPGDYEVRLVVKQGRTVAEDRTFVTVAKR